MTESRTRPWTLAPWLCESRLGADAPDWLDLIPPRQPMYRSVGFVAPAPGTRTVHAHRAGRVHVAHGPVTGQGPSRDLQASGRMPALSGPRLRPSAGRT